MSTNRSARVRKYESAGVVAFALSRSRTLALVVVLAGCAPRQPLPVRPLPETLPVGSPLRSHSLRDSDAWLRHYVMLGEHPRAVEALRARSPLAPRDPLVRALQEGVILHQAGEYRRSNQVLEWAEVEADRRYTRSVTRAAASLLVNDGVMSYTPPAAELVMVPYYRMLNYLAMRDRMSALVEARKANALLARLRREPHERCREDGVLQYLAGLVQRSSGEMNDALVSLRQAEQSFAACESRSEEVGRTVARDLYGVAHGLGVREVADSMVGRYRLDRGEEGPPSGDLLLLVEHGFVAHRSEEAVHVPIHPEDIEGLESGDDDGIATAAERITGRLLRNAWERGARGRSWDDNPFVQVANALDGAYVLRLAWPVLRLEAARPAAVRVWVNDSLAVITPVGDLSAVMQDEMAERRAAMLSRLVARGMVKYLVSREVEKKSEKKGGEIAAFVMGRLANLAANRLEQADLRSWSLLPDRISMTRLRLPEGVHRVRIETVGPDGEVATEQLGEVTVRAGELVVMNRRIWGAESGELPAPRIPPGFALADSIDHSGPGPSRPHSLGGSERTVRAGSTGTVRTRTCPANERAECGGGAEPRDPEPKRVEGRAPAPAPAPRTERPSTRRPAESDPPRRARPRVPDEGGEK